MNILKQTDLYNEEIPYLFQNVFRVSKISNGKEYIFEKVIETNDFTHPHFKIFIIEHLYKEAAKDG